MKPVIQPSREPTAARRPAIATSWRRRWLFRLTSLLLGLSPLLALEGLCCVFDWGRPALHDDPLVGFESVRPLFMQSEDKSRYEIPPARQVYFRPDGFAAAKSAESRRIFCLGGSTVQGRPFKIETSFPTWLEISLNAAEPARRWEVINCGGVSYASYRLLPILEEVLQYEPDLIIIYTGHNEFLEARSCDQIKRRGRLLNTLLGGVSQLRSFTLFREGCLRLQGRSSLEPPPGRPILPTEVDALLDYRGGLEAYRRDVEQRDAVVQQFGGNLRRMIELARRADVEVVLVNPVSNMRDCPPFKALPGDELTLEQRLQWRSLCDAAGERLQAEPGDLLGATDLYEQACRLDPDHADGFYNLAHCYDAAGLAVDAREAFLQAKELDICPLRTLESMNETVLEIARETDTPLCDAQALFESRSPGGIVGSRWLLDHVHPGITGHQLLADALAEKLAEIGFVHPRAGWASRRGEAYRRHFESLPDLYFHQGKERLAAVRAWAQGRAGRTRNALEGGPQSPAD